MPTECCLGAKQPDAFTAAECFHWVRLDPGKTWLQLMRARFPSKAPVFEASDTSPVPGTGNAGITGPGAAEPGLYVVLQPDATFDVTPMKGNGNLVSNAVTLSWFATQYWIGGDAKGRRISRSPRQGGWVWLATGSMPGSSAFLVQYKTSLGSVAAICVIMPIRVPNAQQTIIPEMNEALQRFLQTKFSVF